MTSTPFFVNRDSLLRGCFACGGNFLPLLVRQIIGRLEGGRWGPFVS